MAYITCRGYGARELKPSEGVPVSASTDSSMRSIDGPVQVVAEILFCIADQTDNDHDDTL